MDGFFITGCCILFILIIGYFIVITYMKWFQNPSSTSSLNLQSMVTHSQLGNRGDMGNQLFQIASVLAAGQRSGSKAVFPSRLRELPLMELFEFDTYPIQDVSIDKSYYEYDNYEEIVIPSDGGRYDIRGYRQSYRYFDDYADEIQKLFTPRRNILKAVRAMVPSEYIAVHIRLGDYKKAMHAIPLLREFKSCTIEYYRAGIQQLRETYPDAPLLICTDSPDLIQPDRLDPNCKLASTVPNVNPKFSDFCTLYLANGVVMSNSTYSWWASYLRSNRPIICPSPWWDPKGIIGSGVGLCSDELFYPEWTLLDADTGENVDRSLLDTSPPLDLYRMVRGILI